ncbi:MAG: selenocysteine-specific translation elongation factor [Candidatus Thorarchaeota archaeon]|nr:selenocysteine-specific translation elongation factor [Candidatus Thorarchaeota archaeon]
MPESIPVHIGLMGHIDHGKTELARALSEKVSTAGLDKHPQSQQRGITIDLGFTMFNLGEFVVTLVDAPGHADLIRSVVAGANIIDAAILVIAADEGPMLQTGEHVIVLRSLGIDTVIVALTKSDLVNASQLDIIEAKAKGIMKSAGIETSDIVRVSALTGDGLDNLRATLLRRLVPRERNRSGPFLMPLDHAFGKKGYGTIVTGTVLRGFVRTNDMISIIPLGKEARVRSIQAFGVHREIASAGDRVGINIPTIESDGLKRGDYLCEPNSLKVSTKAICRVKRNPLYKGKITHRMTLSSTIGMPTITSEILPFVKEAEVPVIVSETDASEFEAALLLQRPVGIERGMTLLLMRTDLPPNAMRIVGSGTIIDIPSDIRLSKKRIRKGTVSRIRDEDTLVEGLASSKEIAEKLSGSSVRSATGVQGIIKHAFGTRGVVSVVFEKRVVEMEDILYERLVEEEYQFGH